MKPLYQLIVFTSLLISLQSCNNNNDDDTIIIKDLVGTSNFFLENSTDFDLNVAFVKSQELGFEVDSTNVVPQGNSNLLFSESIIGVNPRPTDSFSEIRLYKSVNENLELVYTMSPINNERWEISQQMGFDNGFEVNDYTLNIRSQDLD